MHHPPAHDAGFADFDLQLLLDIPVIDLEREDSQGGVAAPEGEMPAVRAQARDPERELVSSDERDLRAHCRAAAAQ
ncbi:hypothetical protein D3C86_1585690 [compost metagenome]